ncbi:flap endonuclease GEN-like protein [Rhizoctonia solani 123E]|uniref:Flap endonuclease GEN-like protein n=1 Tax=Rhizoctonia solani 123E TaxID=1423351 RepID=A0A074RK54_9AGAM|nr:flap endonuclease GEN-like protein [Rhizoctonia solani 123E]
MDLSVQGPSVPFIFAVLHVLNLLQAPGEAEAELAYLNNIGVIDAILSDDVDNFLFGARVVIRNPSATLTGNRGYPALNREGKDDGVHVMVYRMDDIERDPACKLTRGGMILIALLSGGDYDQGAKRCGPKTALALAQRGLGDELLNAFETFSRQKFIDYIPAWKSAVVEALHSASQGSIITSSQTSTTSNSRSKKKPTALTAKSIGTGGLTSDVRIGWTGELALGALGRICEQYFEWGVREIIQQRFRTVLWPAVVMRVLRRSVMEQERAQGLSDSRDVIPRPSTPTRDKTKRFVPGTPHKLVNRYFGGDSDSESDREELDTHQLLQAVRGERQHASTDGLQEFRVEVAPGHLARLAVRDLLGTRDPALLAGTLFDLEGAAGKEADEEQEEGDDDEGSTKRLKIVDPSTSIRIWAPAELVNLVHPGLVRDWEAKQTKTKSRAKVGGSTSRQRSKEDVGTGKKVKSTAKSSSKDKAALREKPSNIPTTLSGDEVEQPGPPANPVARLPPTIPSKRRTDPIRMRSASPGMSRPPPVAARSRAPSGKGHRSAFTLNTIPERSSSPTILPERSSPVVTHPPPLPRPTKTKSAPTPLITGASRDSRRAGIPGVEYVPTPPRREKVERSVGNDSSELEDVNFRELLGRPKKHSAPEPDSESESDLDGPSKSSRRNHAHTSPRNSSGSEVEIIKLNPKEDKTRKPTSVANSARRPTTRSQSNSSGSEVEILDCSFLPSRPAKQKSPPMDYAAERVASAPRQVRRTSREHTSPRASSASEGENPKPHVPPRKPTAKRPSRSVSESARSSGKLKESAGSKGTHRPTSADISEGIIEISSDDGGPLLPETTLASKAGVRSINSTIRVAQSHTMTRPDKTAVSTGGSRSSSPPLETSDSSFINLLSD